MRRLAYYSILLLLPAAGALTGCTGKSGAAADNNAAADSVKAEKIKIEVLQKQKISRPIENTSTLEAFEENYLVPASPGRIEKIYVEIGTHVSKGDLLVQMDRTNLHQAEVQLKNVETDYKRLDTLNKVGSISAQQYDQIKTQYEVAKSNVEFLKANTQLHAPFSGVITGKYYEDGEFYSGAPNTPAGKAAIVSIAQLNPLKAIVSVSEQFFPYISNGMTTVVTSDVYPEDTFTGTVFRIHPTIDPDTRTFNVEVKVPNNNMRLRPGMFCRVSLTLGEVDALVVPSVAVLKLQGSNDRYLFIDENGIAKRISVKLGRRFDDKVEVMSGELKEGDKLIVVGQSKLLDGDPVEIVSK